MKNLLLNLSLWRERLRQEPLALFLDYDGTLVAIAPTPAEARLPFATREILKALVRLKDVKVAVISGRPLSELRRMVGVKGIFYVGSHGIEMRLAGTKTKAVSVRYLRELAMLRQKLQVELRRCPGMMLEEKPFSLAIHYRQVASAVARRLKKVVLEVCAESLYRGQVAILTGKKVIELMPPTAMDKGRAVERLWRRWGRNKYMPVFIGDDRTDESAFDRLGGRGLTILVGKKAARTRAGYYVDTADDVRTLLRTILYCRRQR